MVTCSTQHNKHENPHFLGVMKNHLLPVNSLDKDDGVPRSPDRPTNKLDRSQCSRLVPV